MTRSRTPLGASACGLGVQGARPPDPTPPKPQCLFPPGTKNNPVVPPIETKSVKDKLLAKVCSVLLSTYTETEVQHRLCPSVATEVEALLSARAAGWLDRPRFPQRGNQIKPIHNQKFTSRERLGGVRAEAVAHSGPSSGRINSQANLILTEGNTWLSDEEMEKLVVLRMNRKLMSFMRKHYPNAVGEAVP